MVLNSLCGAALLPLIPAAAEVGLRLRPCPLRRRGAAVAAAPARSCPPTRSLRWRGRRGVGAAARAQLSWPDARRGKETAGSRGPSPQKYRPCTKF
jgi:hypothetical protein